jgi:hypothetical protein
MDRRESGGRAGDILMVRWRTRILLLSLPAVGLAVGCLTGPERTYFDDLLDGSADATSDRTAHVEASVSPDGSTSPDATTDVAPGDDAASDGGAAVDSQQQVDSGVEGADGADGGVAPDAAGDGEAGCGSIATISNCGACGAACDRTHSSPVSCNAGTCSYSGCDAGWGDCVPAAPNTNGCETQINTISHCAGCVACDTTTSLDAGCNGTTCTYSGCKPGWSMCKTAPPNTGGCSCNTPGCCVDAGTCQTTHSVGIASSPSSPPPNFYDCNPLNTWTDTSARAACGTYTGNPKECTDGLVCTGAPKLGPYVCNGALSGNCDTCWSYGGTDIGTVTNCGCPGVPLGNYN